MYLETFLTIILDNWVLGNFTLVDEVVAKASGRIKTCVLVNNNLCQKLVSSLELPITFHERFKITSVSFLFLILSYWCELDNLTFIVLYWAI